MCAGLGSIGFMRAKAVYVNFVHRISVNSGVCERKLPAQYSLFRLLLCLLIVTSVYSLYLSLSLSLSLFCFIIIMILFSSSVSSLQLVIAASAASARNIPVDMDSDDGTQLGGVLVVGAGDTGILYEYKEKVFGGTVTIRFLFYFLTLCFLAASLYSSIFRVRLF